MKKLSNRLSVKQSSTKEGQRELIREHTNKTNDIIDWITALEQREGKHELNVITSMQYLEKEIEELKSFTGLKKTLERLAEIDNPSTTIRSTGELTNEELDNMQTELNRARGIDDDVHTTPPVNESWEKQVDFIDFKSIEDREKCMKWIDELLSTARQEERERFREIAKEAAGERMVGIDWRAIGYNKARDNILSNIEKVI